MIKNTKYCKDDNSQMICKFTVIVIKIPEIFVKINNLILKFV